MYCRICGEPINDKAEICVKCGCRPLNGNNYCQECGTKTTEKQEVCVKCGCRLKTSIGKSRNLLDTINNSVNGGNSENMEVNLDRKSVV